MNIKEHLLTLLAEECAEVQQAVTKALRFGTEDGYPGSDTTNAQDIERELIELIAVRDMLRELGVIVQPGNSADICEEKRERVNKYIVYAKSKGTIKYE